MMRRRRMRDLRAEDDGIVAEVGGGASATRMSTTREQKQDVQPEDEDEGEAEQRVRGFK